MTPAKIVTATQSYKFVIKNNNCDQVRTSEIFGLYRQAVSKNTAKWQ